MSEKLRDSSRVLILYFYLSSLYRQKFHKPEQKWRNCYIAFRVNVIVPCRPKGQDPPGDMKRGSLRVLLTGQRNACDLPSTSSGLDSEPDRSIIPSSIQQLTKATWRNESRETILRIDDGGSHAALRKLLNKEWKLLVIMTRKNFPFGPLISQRTARRSSCTYARYICTPSRSVNEDARMVEHLFANRNKVLYRQMQFCSPWFQREREGGEGKREREREAREFHHQLLLCIFFRI